MGKILGRCSEQRNRYCRNRPVGPKFSEEGEESLKYKIPAVLALVVLSVAIALAQSSTNSTITTRPQSSFASFDFPGSTFTEAGNITPSGVIAGSYFTPDGKQHGFVLRDGVFSAVDVPGAASTFIGWINARGDIVGNYTDARGVHVYVLSRGSFTTIDFPGTAPMCKAGFGISDSTRIVGAYVGSDGVTHGFLRQTGNFTTLDVPNSTLTWVTGINPEGDIVGFYNSQDGKQHGFVLSDGEFISIDIPGATSSEANGINPQGDVFGRYVTPDGNTHGYFLRCAACCRHDECSIKQ